MGHHSVIKEKKERKGTFRYPVPRGEFSSTYAKCYFTDLLSVISLTHFLCPYDTEGHICMIPLTGDEVTRCIKTESRMVVAWGMRGAVWGFAGVMKVPGMGSGDGHSTSWMHLLSLNCTLIKS